MASRWTGLKVIASGFNPIAITLNPTAVASSLAVGTVEDAADHLESRLEDS